MAIVSLDCPNCGAKLPPREDTGRTRCEYCGATFETARAPHHRQLPNPTAAAPPPAARSALMIGVGVTVAMVVISTLLFLSTAPSGPAHIMPVAAKPLAAVSSVIMKSNEADFGWDDNGGLPTVVMLDGKEHVLGRIRDRSNGADQLHIAAFDAETGAERYRVGPLGSYTDGYRATHFAVLGDRLVVTDFRSTLKIHDLATGAVQKELPLTDRADRLCLTQESGDAPQLYLAQVDKREFQVDPVAGALKDAKLPKDCDDLDRSGREGDPRARRQDRLRRAPKVDGFEVQGVHLDGTLAVARGVKSPGTEYPMAVGFDPKTHDVRWKTPVAAVDLASVRENDNAQDALAAGRYIATYGEGQEFWHLTAFDAQTGARLWDHKLRSIFAVDWLYGVVATDKNIYLVRMSSLEVHDAATGALKATLGAETYDG